MTIDVTESVTAALRSAHFVSLCWHRTLADGHAAGADTLRRSSHTAMILLHDLEAKTRTGRSALDADAGLFVRANPASNFRFAGVIAPSAHHAAVDICERVRHAAHVFAWHATLSKLAKYPDWSRAYLLGELASVWDLPGFLDACVDGLCEHVVTRTETIGAGALVEFDSDALQAEIIAESARAAALPSVARPAPEKFIPNDAERRILRVFEANPGPLLATDAIAEVTKGRTAGRAERGRIADLRKRGLLRSVGAGGKSGMVLTDEGRRAIQS